MPKSGIYIPILNDYCINHSNSNDYNELTNEAAND